MVRLRNHADKALELRQMLASWSEKEGSCIGTFISRGFWAAPFWPTACPISPTASRTGLSEPLRQTTRQRPLLFDSECPVGVFQSRHCLAAPGTCRRLQPACLQQRAPVRGGLFADVGAARLRIRPLSWRTVTSPFTVWAGVAMHPRWSKSRKLFPSLPCTMKRASRAWFQGFPGRPAPGEFHGRRQPVGDACAGINRFFGAA